MKQFTLIGKKLVLTDVEATPKKKVSRNEESEIQQSIIKWFRCNYTSKEAIICGIPNGAAVSNANRMRLSKEGLYSGFSDLMIISKNRIYFVEVKTEAKSSKQSKEQKDFEAIVSDFGYKYFIVRSLAQFIELCKEII